MFNITEGFVNGIYFKTWCDQGSKYLSDCNLQLLTEGCSNQLASGSTLCVWTEQDSNYDMCMVLREHFSKFFGRTKEVYSTLLYFST